MERLRNFETPLGLGERYAKGSSVCAELKAIFYQGNRHKADELTAAFIEQYTAIYPSAIEWMKRDWEACLTVYGFPEKHWKFIRTTNVTERLFGEVKKRS